MNEKAAQHLALELTCVECELPWLDASERWRIYVTEEDCPEAVLYCHACATREFG
jgi:hypothetical protein